MSYITIAFRNGGEILYYTVNVPVPNVLMLPGTAQSDEMCFLALEASNLVSCK